MTDRDLRLSARTGSLLGWLLLCGLGCLGCSGDDDGGPDAGTPMDNRAGSGMDGGAGASGDASDGGAGIGGNAGAQAGAGSGAGGSAGALSDAAIEDADVADSGVEPLPTEACGDEDACDDGNDCTENQCVNGVCSYVLAPELCGPRQVCTARDGCVDSPACVANIDCAPLMQPFCTELVTCETDAGLCEVTLVDQDGDGHAPIGCGGDDCNDRCEDCFPGNPETCDDVDRDCSGDPGDVVGPGGTGCGYQMLTVGAWHACARRKFGPTVCWGDEGSIDAPDGVLFEFLAAGFATTCGIVAEGHEEEAGLPEGSNMLCWGDQETVISEPLWPYPTTGMFRYVDVGMEHACAITTDGELLCWGNDQYGQATPPPGEFDRVAVGRYHSCGIREDGTLACWGTGNGDGEVPDLGQSLPPEGTFTEVAAASGVWWLSRTCAIRDDGEVLCWGMGTGGSDYICDTADWMAECGQGLPPAGPFTQISDGYAFMCGLRDTGRIECWGTQGQAPPGGEFVELSETCAIDTEGEISCWRYEEYDDRFPEPLRLSPYR